MCKSHCCPPEIARCCCAHETHAVQADGGVISSRPLSAGWTSSVLSSAWFLNLTGWELRLEQHWSFPQRCSDLLQCVKSQLSFPQRSIQSPCSALRLGLPFPLQLTQPPDLCTSWFLSLLWGWLPTRFCWAYPDLSVTWWDSLPLSSSH